MMKHLRSKPAPVWPSGLSALRSCFRRDYPEVNDLWPLRIGPGSCGVVQAGDLTTVRMWNVKGKVTAGPYVQFGRLMCLVDQKRLVWIDPAQDGFLEFETPGDGIVGKPQVIGDSIVVADRDGTIVALDPVTCKSRGPAFAIKMGGPAAATPVALGENQILVPLVDGTAFCYRWKRLIKTE